MYSYPTWLEFHAQWNIYFSEPPNSCVDSDDKSALLVGMTSYITPSLLLLKLVVHPLERAAGASGYADLAATAGAGRPSWTFISSRLSRMARSALWRCTSRMCPMHPTRKVSTAVSLPG